MTTNRTVEFVEGNGLLFKLSNSIEKKITVVNAYYTVQRRVKQCIAFANE